MLARQGSEADIAGGYEINIRNVEQLPIDERLGLVVESSMGSWDTLLPVSPSWVDIDISYRPADYPALFEVVNGMFVPPTNAPLPEFQSEYRRPTESTVDEFGGSGQQHPDSGETHSNPGTPPPEKEVLLV